jgi:hypothetical protein
MVTVLPSIAGSPAAPNCTFLSNSRDRVYPRLRHTSTQQHLVKTL